MNTVSTDSLGKKKNKKELVLLNVLMVWHTKLTIEEVAKKLRVTPEVLLEFVQRNNLPKRPHDPRKKRAKMVDPTPEEIAARAAECLAKRADDDKNATYEKPKRVEIKQYAYSSRTGIFTEM